MTIDAIDFDRGARLLVNFPIAVIVLRKVAIVALHPFFEMNVGEVHGFAEALRIVERDLFAVLVEPVALAIVIEDRAEDPTVPVEVRELRGLQEISHRSTGRDQRRLPDFANTIHSAVLPWGCAALSDTFCRRRFRCPTRLGRNRL
jgi:hypothetical protein